MIPQSTLLRKAEDVQKRMSVQKPKAASIFTNITKSTTLRTFKQYKHSDLRLNTYKFKY